jgi:hypothetical protein
VSRARAAVSTAAQGGQPRQRAEFAEELGSINIMIDLDPATPRGYYDIRREDFSRSMVCSSTGIGRASTSGYRWLPAAFTLDPMNPRRGHSVQGHAVRASLSLPLSQVPLLTGLEECQRLGFVFEDENKIMSLSSAGLG